MREARQRNPRRQVAFLFSERGNAANSTVVGGKGAGLAELVRLGVPVPPGFTVSTTVARAFTEHQRTPRRLANQLRLGVAALERATGLGFGNPLCPLLVSVRSGAPVSMPGMMDTVLNLGLNPAIVREMAKTAGSEFAWDCYRRFLEMYGEIVLGIPREWFAEVVVEDNEERCQKYRELIFTTTDRSMIDDPWEQLEAALLAVLKSWNNPRAQVYRDLHKIPDNLGTAVNIQAMVFGNLDETSGTGVVFSHNVVTGEKGMWGEFLPNAQGEDVVAGIRTPEPISTLQAWNQRVYTELTHIAELLENHYTDVVEIEFTVEKGKLYILQVRVAKRTPEAAATIAVHFQWEKRWSKEEALTKMSEDQVQALQAPGFDPVALSQAIQLGQGLPASPGAAVGRVVTSSESAVQAAARGETVILVRPDTSPDDLPGMLAAKAIVTLSGGATSHAAVVARGLGKPAVVGCSVLMVSEGDVISVDGDSGQVIAGAVALTTVSNKKEVNIFLRWWRAAEAKKWAKPRLNFDTIGEQVSINQLISDFYLADAMAAMARETKFESEALLLKKQIHTAAAERVATYLAVAVTGELRHASLHGLGWKNCAKELERLYEHFGQSTSSSRWEAQEQTLKRIQQLTLEEQIEFFQLAVVVFNGGNWANAYGGKKWAAIASAGEKFLKGELNHSVFADHAFDLQHNCGSVFGKHQMLTGDRGLVEQQLSAKKRAVGVVELHAKMFAYTIPSRAVEELFDRGMKQGIWK